MIYRFADCELDTDRRTLLRSGKEVPTEPQVFDLLSLLAETPDHLVTRDEIVDRVWQGRIVSESAISARIASARKAVGDDGKTQSVIRTVQKQGLMLLADSPAETTETAAVTAPQKVRYTNSPRGQSLAYLVSGKGPALVQLDGPPFEITKRWRIPTLAKGYELYRDGRTLVQLDWAGSGLSEALDVAPSVAENAEDVIAVADAAGLDRFSILSKSGACLEAVQLAATWPERVERLVIVGGYAQGRGLRLNDGEPEVLKTMMEAGWDQLEGGLATAFMMAYFPEGPIDVVHSMIRLMQESSSREFALSMRERSNNVSILDLLPQVRCPTLIVQGQRDAVHPLSEAKKLAAGIPNAELLVLDSANHLPLAGHPVWKAYSEAVTDFLRR